MRFSLIMATIGRTKEVERFLKHLDCQTYRDFELIVVDQNMDNRLVPVLEHYKERFPILYLRSDKGLSRARNVGLKNISGYIVAFPDDDCWYPPDLLERIACFFKVHPEIDGLTGCSVDENGYFSASRWDRGAGLINKFSVWRRGISISIFLKTIVVEKVGNFDKSLGVGANTPWGSGEETDYLLRALKAGFYIYYDPTLFVCHPQVEEQHRNLSSERALNYNRGMGRVLRKHQFPLWFVLYQWARPVGGMFLSLLQFDLDKLHYYYSAFLGRVSGWRKRNFSNNCNA